MHHKCLLSGGVLVAIAMTCGCTGAGSRYPTPTDLQMDKMYETRNTPPVHLSEMADNAMLQDMAIEDFHFVGHSSELSGAGAMRLSRMSPLLSAYGGTLNYETNVTDEKLVQERLKNVREYLTMTGCDMSRVEVKTGLSQGTGMNATKAIMIDMKGTSKPSKDSGGPSAVTVSTDKGQPNTQ